MARKTKFTKERRDKIIALIRDGNYPIVAARASGINADTFYEWLKRGKRDIEDKKLSAHAEFSELVLVAEAEAEAEAVSKIKTVALTDEKSAQWFLERKHPERWGRNDKVRSEITGAGGKEIVVVDARSSVLEFLASRNKQQEEGKDNEGTVT